MLTLNHIQNNVGQTERRSGKVQFTRVHHLTLFNQQELERLQVIYDLTEAKPAVST